MKTLATINVPSRLPPHQSNVKIPPVKVPSSCNPAIVMMPPATNPSIYVATSLSVMMPPANYTRSCNPEIPVNRIMPPTPSFSLMIAELNDSSDSSFLSDSSIDLTILNDSKDVHHKWGLLSSAEITLIYVKSRNYYNFVLLLVKRLFDIQTRLRSNVAGHGKERLDPVVMKSRYSRFMNAMSLRYRTSGRSASNQLTTSQEL